MSTGASTSQAKGKQSPAPRKTQKVTLPDGETLSCLLDYPADRIISSAEFTRLRQWPANLGPQVEGDVSLTVIQIAKPPEAKNSPDSSHATTQLSGGTSWFIPSEQHTATVENASLHITDTFRQVERQASFRLSSENLSENLTWTSPVLRRLTVTGDDTQSGAILKSGGKSYGPFDIEETVQVIGLPKTDQQRKGMTKETKKTTTPRTSKKPLVRFGKGLLSSRPILITTTKPLDQ
ncbi:hypothetical protein BCR39DRAFT_552760 [Naematelia encephala]|uniref:Uncharacterized protein n=1 Tax=Naematelia encephala TaxID=71784 RepID=A0A1Y2AIU4_9TREE|nr:hypothetical protein BCR39DRAFT_552760 [Naematelia encephala]